MMTSVETPFCSPRIQSAFQAATERFRQETHDSLAANAVIECLWQSKTDSEFATGSRNDCVERLAKAVESKLQCSANLLFRTPGRLHTALQELMDSYMDAMDGIYYHT